jgi:PAS domain S-box-containing protein
LLNNQVKWKDFVQSINSPALISDSSHIILDYNKSFNDFSGLSGEDMVGKNCSNVFHQLNFEETCKYHGSTEDREVYETHEMENYGKHALVSCTPIHNENNDLEFTVHILTEYPHF